MMTKKQKQIYDFILKFIEKYGYSPTYSEIARKLKINSPSTIYEHILGLESLGFIKKEKHHHRSISTSSKVALAPKIRANHPRKSIEELQDKVIEADCLKAMRDIPSGSIDMILCDLPYGTTQNAWDSVIPLEELWYEYERVIKDRGVIALTSQGIFTAQLILSNSKLFKYKLVWVKSKSTNFLNAKKQPLRKHEDICIFYKNQPDYSPQMTPGEPYDKGIRKNQLTGSYGTFGAIQVKSDGGRYPTDVIYVKTAESEGEIFHPTQKPIELGRYLIKTYTKPGAIVLDNTCGSGSFLVAAVLENRKFIGIELNEENALHKKHPVDNIKVCEMRIQKARVQVANADQIPSKGISGNASLKLENSSAVN